MRSPRRRRRDDDDDSDGLPILPLFIVVVLSGLLLGGLIAHFWRSPLRTLKRPVPMPTAIFTPAPAPTLAPTPSPASTPTPKPKPTPKHTPTPKPSASPKATPTPKPSPTASPGPRPSPTPHPRSAISTLPSSRPTHSRRPPVTPQPAATQSAPTPSPIVTPQVNPTPVSILANNIDRAKAVVRSYLDALARGDTSAAQAYLAGGTTAKEAAFMNSSAVIQSLPARAHDNGTFTVNADVTTSSGEYYITFTLEPGPGGMKIIRHFSIKTR